jgi:two-component system, cell cycle response regulator
MTDGPNVPRFRNHSPVPDPRTGRPFPAFRQLRRPKKTLNAEDHVQSGRMLGKLLQSWGYEAAVVHDGEAALETLRGPHAPRLALLDWQMPGLDGFEVCRRLRREADRPYAYLLLLTGLGGRREMLEGLDAGADDFLTKPFDEAELKARLATGQRIVTVNERLRDLATRDDLTGLWKRVAVLELLDRELARGRRDGHAVGVLLADVDHFKRVNDTLGNLIGDEVLRQAARRLREALRPYDAVGRYDGEEFLVVLPGCGAGAAAAVAERLRERVAEGPVGCSNLPIGVTISVGVAASQGASAIDAAALVRAADRALNQAKGDGRNQAVLGLVPE